MNQSVNVLETFIEDLLLTFECPNGHFELKLIQNWNSLKCIKVHTTVKIKLHSFFFLNDFTQCLLHKALVVCSIYFVLIGLLLL